MPICHIYLIGTKLVSLCVENDKRKEINMTLEKYTIKAQGVIQ